MKKSLLIIAIAFLSSCGWTRIGTLTTAGTRNIDSKQEYVELARYIDSRKAKNLPGYIKRSESSEPLNKAIDRVVSSVHGGEFLKNVQIYTQGSSVRIMADVWGVELPEEKKPEPVVQAQPPVRPVREPKPEPVKKDYSIGFSSGDKVTWRAMGKQMVGKIIGKSEKTAAISYNDKAGKEVIKNVEYQFLTKID